ncbi:MAG: FapA family protein [Methylococcales bacterium]|nr:FapA family protein [Methylococcales bacterium]
MNDEVKTENGLGFKTCKDNRKLFAVYTPCSDKIALTATIFKERLAASPFADLFVNEYLVTEFLRRYKDASDNECFECEIGERRDAHCDIRISDDKLKAHLSITPNFGGKPVTLADVLEQIESKKIVWGLAPIEDIQAVVDKAHVADFLIAQGLEPVEGVDAKFLSLMPEVHERKPHVDENGDVDYRELGDIVIVHKDEVLMQRIPPVPGKKGRSIFGEIIEPTGGADTPFSGDKKGVYLNPEDSNQLLSSITGQPVTIPNGMIVSPVLTVKQVDFSSGNLRFDGSIVVQGDVKEGMKVYALEDITIEGNVTDAQIECMGCLNIKGGVTGNSDLIANGEINIKGGVQGTQEIDEPVGDEVHVAKIVSHSSVIVGFVENFNIEAGVDIVVEKYAMNSQLMAGNKIVAGLKGGKKSSLMGGITWAMMMVKAAIIGSTSGIKTHVQVGTNPYIQKRIQAIRKNLAPNEKEQKDIHKILAFIDSHPEKGNAEILEKLHHTLSKLVLEAEQNNAELKELVANMTAIEDAKVIAERGVFTGTEVQINNVLWKAQENRARSVFRVEKREMTINTR